MNEKLVGVYLDHAAARLIEPAHGSVNSRVIISPFDHDEMEFALSKSEHVMHNKEHKEQLEYYREIGAGIKDYDKILLFGPTKAKNELYNLLTDDPAFAGKVISVKQTDKIQVDEQENFVRDHFDELIKK